MKKLMTTICCVSLALVGYFITFGEAKNVANDQNMLHAATTLNWGIDGLKPIGVQLNDNNLKDTVYVEIHDTVTVNNIEYVRVPVPQHTTDTLYVPIDSPLEADIDTVSNKKQDTRSIESVILLTVDGEVVYDSHHSDGLKEP